MSATANLAGEYSAKAHAYAELWAPVLRPFALPLLDALPLAAASQVLDLGAGTGHLHDPIRTRAPRCNLVLADRAAGMLRLAPAGPRASRIVVDAQRLAFANGVFDVAVLAFVLFHLPEPTAGLREARRVLRPGGVVGVVTWSDDAVMPGGEVSSQELDALGAAPDSRDPSTMQHALMDTPEKLSSLLVECGFRDVDVRETRFAHPFTVAGLLELQLGVGIASRRIRSLTNEQAATYRARVAERLHQLSPEQLVYHAGVVWACGTAPK